MSKRSSSLTETKSLISKDHLSKFDERRPAGYPSDKEIPVVLVLKRKAIRVYPDNQKVVLYYSQALDKYVSIPFGPKSDVLGSPLNESRKPKKEKEDNSDLYKVLASKYPGIASQYKKAKEEQPERRALRRIAMKLTRKQKEALSPKERDAIYNTSKELIRKSNMPISHELGALTGLWAQKKWGDYKSARKARLDKSKTSKSSTSSEGPSNISPTGAYMPPKMGKTSVSSRPSIAESYKNRLRIIREARDYGKVDAAADIASFAPGPAGSIASLGSAGLSLSRGDYTGALLDVAGALPGVGYAAKSAKVARQGAKLASKTKTATNLINKAMKTKIGKRLKVNWRGLKRKGGKAAGTAAGAGIAALDALKSADTGVSKAAETGAKYGGAQPYQFSLQPKVGGPGPRLTADPSTIEGKVARSLTQPQQMRESSNIDKIKYIVENNINSYEMTFEGNDSTINLNNRVAKKVLQVYETLNTKNQKKFSKMLNENATTFKQAINFVIRH